MRLFIGLFSFSASPELIDATKVGVLSGSLASALWGMFLLRIGRYD